MLDLNANEPAKPERSADPLLLALEYLTRYHLNPRSSDSLQAGLPLSGQAWDAQLFIRAADQAGFNAAAAGTNLLRISPLTLPVVIQTSDYGWVVLEQIGQQTCTIVLPNENSRAADIATQELEDLYLGTCLYCKPKPIEDTKQSRQHWFWNTIALSKGIYAEIIVASLLINLFALVSPLFIMNVYDRVVPNYALETLWVLSSGVLIIFGFDLAMKMLRAYFIDIAGKRADILLSAKTFSRVMDIQLSARPKQIGSFANNLQEFDTFREFFTSTTLTALIDLPFVCLFLFLIYGIGGPLALIPLISIPVIIGFGMLVQKPLHHLIEDTFNQSAQKHALLIEALSALDTIKSQRAEGQIQSRWEAASASLAKLTLQSRLLTSGAINVSQVVQQLSTVGVVIYGVYLIMDGNLSVGGLIACTILTGRCLAPMGQVAGILTRYHHSLAAYRSIDSMMKLPVERPENKKFLHRSSLTGSIEFKDVSFSYLDQKVPALKQLSFTIAPGEKVGIVGKMGSGKTTIQKLCMGFYQPNEGSILLSETDINQIDPQDIRKNAIYVGQDIQLFSGTVRDNITLGAPLATDEQIRKAAAISGLLEFLQQHPEGFDMQVGERGNALSGGQRQAVALARAMINQAQLLLLDEPTSGMDSTAELNFKQHLEQITQDKTLLLITHKSSMLALVDRLILINDGQKVADGPRDEVLRALAGSSS